MVEVFKSIRGYVSIAVGFVACPCHLPITLPIFLSLTAGTALGTWLSANTVLIYVLFSIVFIGGLGLGFVWLNATPNISPKSERFHHSEPSPTRE